MVALRATPRGQADAAKAESRDGHMERVGPHCGGSLVRGVVAQGARAGRAFLGCANYPKTRCGFILNVEE